MLFRSQTISVSLFAIPAGSPPAAPKLALLRPIAPQSYRQSRRARCGLLVHPDLLSMALQKVHRRNRCCPTSYPTLRPNPHNAAAPPCPTSRDFLPWRFSNAGRRNAWIASSCRRPKTCTARDSCTAAIFSSIRYRVGADEKRRRNSGTYAVHVRPRRRIPIEESRPRLAATQL